MTGNDVQSRRAFLWLQQILLINLSILLFPVSVLALFYNYAALVLCPQNGLRRHVRRSPRFRPRKVVITGVSTSAGLRVARALYATGHNIVGIEEGGLSILNHARWSKAVSRFHTVAATNGTGNNSTYANNLFRIVVKERADLWIECSAGVSVQAKAQAKRMIEERSTCLCIVPSSDHIKQFETYQEFRQLAQQLGLPSPETFSVRSRHDIHNVLSGSDGKRYMLSSPNGTSEPPLRTILPRRTVSQTYDEVSQLKLSKAVPWTLEQYTEGLPQFTACAVVVKGKPKTFAASSVSGYGECKSVRSESGLSDAMKQYMHNFSAAVGPNLTCHLTMNFCLEEKATHAGVVQQILPLSGHLLPHESLLLFAGKRGSIDLTRAYTSVLLDTTTDLEVYTGLPLEDSQSDVVTPAEAGIGVYYLYNDLQNLIVAPIIKVLTLQSSILSAARAGVTFLQHLVAWQEALYDFGDPLPLFWYTHVSTPCQLSADLVYKTWSRLSSGRRTRYRDKLTGRQAMNGTSR